MEGRELRQRKKTKKEMNIKMKKIKKNNFRKSNNFVLRII